MSIIDLDALEAEALQSASEQATTTIAYRGATYEILRPVMWPLSAQRRLVHGDMEGFDEILGPGVWDALCDAGMTNAGFMALMQTLRTDGGLGPPSSRSSA